MSRISSLAIVEDGCELSPDVEVAALAVVKRGTILGSGVKVDHHAVLGGEPQDLRFDSSTRSGVKVGEHTVIREGVTISRATTPDSYTTVGKRCMLMANCHLGHDVVVGNHVVVANAVLMGGYVVVEDYCFLGGGALLHQSTRIGEGAIISGGSRVSLDVPPFVVVSERNVVHGLNLVGLKRRGFTAEQIADIKVCYRAVYFHPGSPAKKAAEAQEQGLAKTPYGEQFLRFFAESKRGVVRAGTE